MFPSSTKGLNPKEHTIADHLKGQGYATACFGKWHLGHHKEVLPTSNGFDTYFGIPYSNDMNHPDNKGKPRGGWAGMDVLWADTESTLTKWKTPLFEDEKIVELPVDQRTITRRCTQKSIDFIKANKDKPFFVYVPHSMPHIPLYRSKKFEGKSLNGIYGDVIEEIDWSVGQVLNTLRKQKLHKKTIVLFTSDNGPWEVFKPHGGSAGLLRGAKGGTREGGMREPAIFWGPGNVKPGLVQEMGSTLDVLPTFASLAVAKSPDYIAIEG